MSGRRPRARERVVRASSYEARKLPQHCNSSPYGSPGWPRSLRRLLRSTSASSASTPQASRSMAGAGIYSISVRMRFRREVRSGRWLSMKTDPFHSSTLNDDRSLGSRDHLRYNRDGSLDIAIQHDPPTAGQVMNWLSAPEEPFNLVVSAASWTSQFVRMDWRVPSPQRIDAQAG